MLGKYLASQLYYFNLYSTPFFNIRFVCNFAFRIFTNEIYEISSFIWFHFHVFQLNASMYLLKLRLNSFQFFHVTIFANSLIILNVILLVWWIVLKLVCTKVFCCRYILVQTSRNTNRFRKYFRYSICFIKYFSLFCVFTYSC